MKPQFLEGDETWQELKAKAEAKYDEVQRRRRDPETGASTPVGKVDVVLIGEANFLAQMAAIQLVRQ